MSKQKIGKTVLSELGKALGQIESTIICRQKTEDERSIPGLVNHIIENLIHPSLQAANIPVVEVTHAGSQQEYTALPGSDYDLQFAINMANVHPKPRQVNSTAPGWKLVKGGPAHLLSRGYLSNEMIRQKIRSAIDSELTQYNGKYSLRDSNIRLRRADAIGPSVVLLGEWKDETFAIDVVATVRETDLENPSGFSLFARLITVPDSKVPRGEEGCLWRISKGPMAADKMDEFNRSEAGRRKLSLLKTIKVIKKHESQLAMFPTAFYKNILFYLSDEKHHDNQWTSQRQFALRFMDMIRMVRNAVRSGELLNYFDREVNTLHWHTANKPAAMTNLENYLSGIVDKGGYMRLLRFNE